MNEEPREEDFPTDHVPETIDHEVFAAMEAMLFAAEKPLGVPEFIAVFEECGDAVLTPRQMRAALDELRRRIARRAAGIELTHVAGGWQLRTASHYARHVNALYQRKPVRLSRAALEVLAITAYRQPCTRADVDEIRGVDSSSTLRQLIERGLLRILGKADDVGRPLLYGTSDEFLEFFGLESLAQLPTLREFTELSEEHLVQLEQWETSLEESTQRVAEDALEEREAGLESLEENREAGEEEDADQENGT